MTRDVHDQTRVELASVEAATELRHPQEQLQILIEFYLERTAL
jgi:hypothetical protein